MIHHQTVSFLYSKQIQSFIILIKLMTKIIGFDGYFKGNTNKYPLFVVSFISKNLKSLPLCLCLTNDAKKETIEKLIKILKKEFNLEGFVVSIDNDDSEKYAFNKNDMFYILCKFHLIKCKLLIIFLKMYCN